MSRLLRTAREWFDRNFTPKGFFGLLLLLITAIPDWASREDFWKGRMHGILQFVLSPYGRALLICAGILVVFLDHHAVIKAKEAQLPVSPDSLDVELTPSSGPSKRMLLSVTNRSSKQRLHATCKLLERRGDPNPLNKQTYDLAWERQSWRILKLATGESCNLLIATAELLPNLPGWPGSEMAEAKLKGFSEGAVENKEWSRWGGNDGPEYDLEIAIFGERGSRSERFTLKCGGRVSALEMYRMDRSAEKQVDQRPQMWESLAAKFKELPVKPIPIWGEWIYTNETKQYQWTVRHSSEVSVKMCIELCKEAGRLLLREPSFQMQFPDVSAVLDDDDRWLVAVYKVAGIGKVHAHSTGINNGIHTTAEGGRIDDVGGASQVLCQMARNGF